MKTLSSLFQKYSRVIILLLICIILSLVSDNFLNANNLLNVVRQSSMLLIMSLGMTCALLLGRGPDLCIGSTLAFTSCISAGFLTQTSNIWQIVLGIAIALVVGIVIGVINGALIAFLKLPALLVTLGMQQIVRGAVYAIMNGQIITNLHDSILFVGTGRLFNTIPMPIIIAGFLTVFVAIILKRTRIGRELYVVGANATAAKFSGIKTNKTIIFGFAISSFLAAFAGIVYLGRLGTAEGEIGQAFAFQSVGAAAIGGVSFNGGMGSAWGTVIGALILNILINGMNLLNVSSLWQGTMNGLIIIGAVVLDNFARKGTR